MNRLPRLLRNTFTILSLFLFISSIFLWIRSHRAPTAIHPTTWAMLEYLAQPAPADSAAHATLSTALRQISWKLGATIEIDWPALEAIQLSRLAHFDYQYNPQPLGQAIQTILLSYNSHLEFTTHDDVIRISTIGAARHFTDIERMAQRDPIWIFTRSGPTRSVLFPPEKESPLWEPLIRNSRFTFIANHGTFAIWRTPKDPAFPYRTTNPPSTSATPKLIKKFGFSLQRIGYPYNTISIALPFWSLTLLTAIPPSLWLLTFLRRHHRRKAHLCPHCGYDLRATPTLCPECGHVPS